MTVKHRALLAGQSLLKHFGLWLDRYERQPVAQRQKLLLRERVDHVIDVGAHAGEYVSELRSGGYVGLVTSFEPNPQARSRLLHRAARDAKWQVEPWALGDNVEHRTLRVSENEVSSSLLEIQPRHLAAAPASRVVQEIGVEVRRLDDISPAISGSSLLLKLDVQGAEAAVLDGARETLQRVSLLELELSIVELYLGEASLIEMLTLVDGLDFVLVLPMTGFMDHQTGRCLQMNGVFARC